MVKINKNTTYLERQVASNKSNNRCYKPQNFRDWWLGKKQIYLGMLTIPKELHGKKIKFKIEIMEEINNKNKQNLERKT